MLHVLQNLWSKMILFAKKISFTLVIKVSFILFIKRKVCNRKMLNNKWIIDIIIDGCKVNKYPTTIEIISSIVVVFKQQLQSNSSNEMHPQPILEYFILVVVSFQQCLQRDSSTEKHFQPLLKPTDSIEFPSIQYRKELFQCYLNRYVILALAFAIKQICTNISFYSMCFLK